MNSNASGPDNPTNKETPSHQPSTVPKPSTPLPFALYERCNETTNVHGRQNRLRTMARGTVSQRWPHHALGYRTPAEVFHGEQGAREDEYYGRRCAPGEGSESKASARKTANAPSVVPAQAGTQGRGLSLPARRAVPQFAHTQRMKTQMVGGGLITI